MYFAYLVATLAIVLAVSFIVSLPFCFWLRHARNRDLVILTAFLSWTPCVLIVYVAWNLKTVSGSLLACGMTMVCLLAAFVVVPLVRRALRIAGRPRLDI